LPKAVNLGCWIDVERDVYRQDPTGEIVLIGEADEVITVASQEQHETADGGGVATLAAPRSIREVVIDLEEARHRQHYLVVRENPAWPRALAVVELLTPANKIGLYAQTYNKKRAKMHSG
jgi:hypothetical protein